MDVGGLYQFALVVILVGMIVGIGVLVLDKFAASSGITPTAQLALNNSRDAVGGIANTWLTLIVTVGVLAVILALVIGAFAMRGGTR